MLKDTILGIWLTGRMLACQSRGLGFSWVVVHAYNDSTLEARQEDL